MRKIILAATVAAFALTVSACSESTEQAADAAVDGAAADASANADAMGAAVEGAATDAGNAVEGAAADAGAAVDTGVDAVAAGSAAAEAELQNEPVSTAAAD